MYSNKGVVFGSQCDYTANLSTLGALQIVQDHICRYFGGMGVDEIRLKRDFGCIWVFVKNKLEFKSPLKWDEGYRVECFISSLTGARMVVDTIIYGKKDELKIYAKTEVCTLNLETQKIVPIKQVLTKETEVLKSKSDLLFEKLDDFFDLQIIKTHTVHSTSIDYCIHTNNVSYVRFIMDTFDTKFLLEHPIKEIQINYISQTGENDVLDISRSLKVNEQNFEIKNGPKVAVRCKIKF